MCTCEGDVAPPTQEVRCAIVLALSRLCSATVSGGNVCGLLVGFLLLVKFSLRIGILEEQDGVVSGVS